MLSDWSIFLDEREILQEISDINFHRVRIWHACAAQCKSPRAHQLGNALSLPHQRRALLQTKLVLFAQE